MFYTADITRANPACFLLLIDQSESMSQPFVGGATRQSKASAVADAINRLLQNLVLRSAKAEGIRDYFLVGVIGYGKTVRAGFGGKLPFEVLVPISRLAENPLRMETRKRSMPDGTENAVKFPVWFDELSDGATPMCEALAAAGLVIQNFIEKYPESFPPIVLNMTDGLPSDGNPQATARIIRRMSTADGNVLLFNLLLSSELRAPSWFPADESLLTGNCAKLLFRMSSEMPSGMRDAAKSEGQTLPPKARGVVINADPLSIVRFLDIGTRVSSLAP